MAEAVTNPTQNTSSEPTPVAGQKINSFKVGWLFVHEYYTILNKEPWRLHCFYGRNSTLIRGTEGQKVMTIVGEQEIREKIKQLNLDNCRVLVTNVDSQSSLNGGIVVQVLGEMSNGNEETSRKFAQTFFLAEQPNGYYVLNDIIRFLNEEEEVNSECDEVDEGAIEESVGNEGGEEDIGSSPTGTLVEEPINVPTIIEDENVVTHTREISASEVTPSAPNINETESVPSASLMSASVSEGQQANSSLVTPNDTLNASSDNMNRSQGIQNAIGSPSVHANKTPELSVVASENSASNVTNDEVVPVKSVVNGEPIAQSSSDAKKIGTVNAKDEIVVNAVQASVTNQQVTQPTSQPQGPKTWASTLFKSGGNTQVESRPQSVPATLPVQKVQQKPTPQNSQPPQQQNRDNRNFRQDGPRGNNRRNSDTNFSIYVKGVTQKLNYDQLRSSLGTFGHIKYLDVVYNKSCAFVEFVEEESYKECLNRHTLSVSNHCLTFEERRPSRNNNNRGGNNKPPRRGY